MLLLCLCPLKDALVRVVVQAQVDVEARRAHSPRLEKQPPNRLHLWRALQETWRRPALQAWSLQWRIREGGFRRAWSLLEADGLANVLKRLYRTMTGAGGTVPEDGIDLARICFESATALLNRGDLANDGVGEPTLALN